jgi:FtsP/CotA-like multicopper oxidase with cupredoxin domain
MDMPAMAMAAMKSKPDLNDVRYDAFLANGRTLADPEVTSVERGGRALLRIINGSSMSAYNINFGRLEGDLIAVDGMRVQPVRGHNFPITVAQRLDTELTIPKTAAAYPVLAVLEGDRWQTGIVLLAGTGRITRTSGMADAASPPLALGLERRLRAAEPLADRKADRTHVLNLTGSMQGYRWSINNVAWSKDVPPLTVTEGERVELVLTNQTMMPHPMHLHGHSFQVVAIDGHRFPGAVRDTVLVLRKHGAIAVGSGIKAKRRAAKPGLSLSHAARSRQVRSAVCKFRANAPSRSRSSRIHATVLITFTFFLILLMTRIYL